MLTDNSNRVGQVFTTYGDDGHFTPTKISAYLRRFGNNTNNYYILDDDIVLDATNFSTLTSGANKVMLEDDYSNYTNNGYMQLHDNSGSTWDRIVYPIAAVEAGLVDVWLRVRSPSTNGNLRLYFDALNVVSYNNNLGTADWIWINLSFVLPDVLEHTLSLEIREADMCVDKIIIGFNNVSTPSGVGPALSTPQFVTAHMKIYEVDSNYQPTNSILIYDYKNTIDDIKLSDWQNFACTNIDTVSEGFNNEYYAMVLSSSGSTESNFIVWDILDNNADPYDPYGVDIASLPSIFRTI